MGWQHQTTVGRRMIQNVLLNVDLTALLGNGTLPLGGDLLRAYGTKEYTVGHKMCDKSHIAL